MSRHVGCPRCEVNDWCPAQGESQETSQKRAQEREKFQSEQKKHNPIKVIRPLTREAQTTRAQSEQEKQNPIKVIKPLHRTDHSI